MARSNNNNKLKAFVRFDGSGRIIPSSLIVQAFKPKVGNYQEIDAKECCNYVAPTTTTTTTAAVPTEFTRGYWVNTEDACSTTTTPGLVFYSSSSTIESGIAVFTDVNLTTPVTLGFVILAGPSNMTRYLVGAGGVLSEYSCG
jgi:hypothetical protein